MTIVVIGNDIINKNVRTPCHPEGADATVGSLKEPFIPGDSSRSLRMTAL